MAFSRKSQNKNGWLDIFNDLGTKTGEVRDTKFARERYPYDSTMEVPEAGTTPGQVHFTPDPEPPTNEDFKNYTEEVASEAIYNPRNEFAYSSRYPKEKTYEPIPVPESQVIYDDKGTMAGVKSADVVQGEYDKAKATGQIDSMGNVITAFNKIKPEAPDGSSILDGDVGSGTGYGDIPGIGGLKTAFDQMQSGLEAETKAQGEFHKKANMHYESLANAMGAKKIQDEFEQDNLMSKIAEDEKALEDTIAEYKESKVDPRMYWKNMNVWGKALAGISIMLGSASSAALDREGNPALDVVMRAIDQNIDAQKMQIQKKGTEVSMRFNVVNQMYKKWGNMNVAQQASKVAMLDVAKLKMESLVNASKSDLVKANGTKAMGLLNQKRQEAYMGFAESLSKIYKNQTGQGADLKQWQHEAAGFGLSMTQAEDDFTEIYEGGHRPQSWMASGGRILPQAFKSPLLKRQMQAETHFINAILRRESGAAISDSEYIRGEQQYFARIGDTPEVLEQKRLARLGKIAGLRSAAGGAWDMAFKSYQQMLGSSGKKRKAPRKVAVDEIGNN